MSTSKLLDIEPQELQFPIELRKQASCSLQLLNKTEIYVAFKVKTTNPKKYSVRPNAGIVMPRSKCGVVVKMQACKEIPKDMQCKEKFLLQSVVVSPWLTAKDITREMFDNKWNQVEECKLRVVYLPPRPPSLVLEGSKEGSCPRALVVSNNGNFSASEQNTSVSRSHVERRSDSHESLSEARALISKLSEEKNAAIQQSTKFQQELELLKRQGKRSCVMYAIIIGSIGFIMGYFLKKI